MDAYRSNGMQYRRALNLGTPLFFIMGSKQICLFLERKTLSLFSKAIPYTNTLEKIIQNKGQLMFYYALKICITFTRHQQRIVLTECSSLSTSLLSNTILCNISPYTIKVLLLITYQIISDSQAIPKSTFANIY